ncbi:MAG: peroxiredoxin family protein [Deltaproteobacteria bacterium]|nr:peroxiredoxin family protein [Deltaproteobacteria bacterium]MBK8720365.1 peroxiredoxin family protein [Deltaproteobacteria bacterium]MBP7285493.1 peroxiredoxin family protein [Nannocystaceae bacterium]
MRDNHQAFIDRGVQLVAVSVDAPADSVAWADAKHLDFDLASDPDEVVIGRYGLVNPDTPELSLHAIYIVDPQGRVFYRKIARRRAYADELLDAIDYHFGPWPRP